MLVASENHDETTSPVTGLWFEAALLPGGWAENVRLSISRGIIADVQQGTPLAGSDERCSVAIPGLTDVHSHAFQRGMAGLAEVRGPGANTFWSWREVMYHFLDRINPDEMEAIAAMAYVEMLESGFTRVAEFHYVHHDIDGSAYDNVAELSERICAAATASGINLTLLPSFYAHSDFGGAQPTAGQRRFMTSPDQFGSIFQQATICAGRLPGGNVGIAPHSLRAVTADELRRVLALCKEGPIHIHAAEQVREVEACVAATGARPVQWLLDHAPLDRRWCLVHATHMTPAEIAGLTRTGATVGLCPVTEANLGDGIFPGVPFIAQKGILAIGTDSNVSIDAAAELRTLEYSQRLANRARNIFAHGEGSSSGRGLFERVLAGGTRATNVASSGLQIGSPADIVGLACKYHELTPRERGDAILDRWIFAGRHEGAVSDVWVRGTRAVSGGRHFAREETRRNYQRTLRRILAD